MVDSEYMYIYFISSHVQKHRADAGGISVAQLPDFPEIQL